MFSREEVLNTLPYLPSGWLIAAILVYTVLVAFLEYRRADIPNQVHAFFCLFFLVGVPAFTLEFHTLNHISGAVIGFFITFLPATKQNPMYNEICLFTIVGFAVGLSGMFFVLAVASVLGIIARFFSLFQKEDELLALSPVLLLGFIFVTSFGMYYA